MNSLKNKDKKIFPTIISIFLISIFFFFLGRLSLEYELNKDKKIERNNKTELKIIKNDNKNVGVIASKKGTTYHLPWCPGANAMSQKNKIYFNSIPEAEAAGYKAAKNCEGL